MDEKYTSSVFKEWIKNHETKDYQIIENNQDCIELIRIMVRRKFILLM